MFLYANDSYRLADKKVEIELKRLHAGFVAFLLDIAPKTVIGDDVDLDEKYEAMIRSASRGDKIVDNVKQSISNKVYSANEMGFYLGTLLSNQDINLAPSYLELDTTIKFNFKKLLDSLSPLISKGKRYLLKFIYNPASMSTYTVKEKLIKTIK